MRGEGAQKFPNTLKRDWEELTLSRAFVKGLQLKTVALYTGDPFSPPTQKFLQTSNLGLSFDFLLGEKSS